MMKGIQTCHGALLWNAKDRGTAKADAMADCDARVAGRTTRKGSFAKRKGELV